MSLFIEKVIAIGNWPNLFTSVSFYKKFFFFFDNAFYKKLYLFSTTYVSFYEKLYLFSTTSVSILFSQKKKTSVSIRQISKFQSDNPWSV